MGKTNPLNDADMSDFVTKQAAFAEGPNSWSVAADRLDAATFDLTVRNPNALEVEALRSPAEILDEIARLDTESSEVLARVRELL
jgi:type I restriction enzyme M protein